MKYYIAIIITLLGCGDLWAGTTGKLRAGNKLYHKEKYEQAVGKYREAQIAAPENDVVHFNTGDALYKAGQFDEAAVSFNKALNSKDPLLRSRAYYNLGNTAFRQQKNDEALAYYKKALDLNPSDRNAKYNIEYILSHKDQQKKNDQNNKDGKDKQNKKQGGGQDDQQKSDQDRNKGGQNDKDKSGMSKEDAQRILQYYNDSDKEAAKKRKMSPPQLPKVEEDW